MTSLLQQMGLWHWLILAVGLFIGEMLVPGTFLVWMGLGAAATGGLLLLVPALPWQAQWLCFAVVSAGSVLLWRRYRRLHPASNDHPTLNQRGMSYVGRHFTLGSPIVDGVGKLQVDDSSWKIMGEDLPAGAHVKVIGVDGTMLRVAALAAPSGAAGSGHAQ